MSKEKSKSQQSTNDNIGPSAGGYFEIQLPDDWGLLRLWAEETEVKSTGGGFDQYQLRFNLNDPIEPKQLRGHQIMKNFQSGKNSDSITTCTGNVTEFLTPINDPKEMDKTRPVMANINWNEYSYLPRNFFQTKNEQTLSPTPSQSSSLSSSSSSSSSSTTTTTTTSTSLRSSQKPTKTLKRTESETKSLPPKSG